MGLDQRGENVEELLCVGVRLLVDVAVEQRHVADPSQPFGRGNEHEPHGGVGKV